MGGEGHSLEIEVEGCREDGVMWEIGEGWREGCEGREGERGRWKGR